MSSFFRFAGRIRQNSAKALSAVLYCSKFTIFKPPRRSPGAQQSRCASLFLNAQAVRTGSRLFLFKERQHRLYRHAEILADGINDQPMIFLLLHARNGNGTNESAAFEVNREAAAYTCELCRFQTGIGKRIAAGCHLQADQIRTLPEHVGCADLSAKSAEVDGAIDCIA